MTQKPIDPMVHFRETPETFSAKSSIADVVPEDFRRGIILDGIDEVAFAVAAYDSGFSRSAGATQTKLYEDLEPLPSL